MILAGGLGTRLRPLTETLPKPLLPIMNVPMVEHVITLLPEEVDTLVIAVSYKANEVRQYFDAGKSEATKRGMDVVVIDEGKPLGTGGAVKNVEKYLDGTFIVLNGDVICSLSMKGMMAHHRAMRGVGTISAWRIKDPTPYGVMETHPGSERIIAFTEKPEKGKARSDLINAGTYILEPEILDLIPAKKAVSMEREVFPKALGMTNAMFTFAFDGYWFDAGKPADYLAIHQTLIQMNGSSANILCFKWPGLAGEGCTIGRGSVVGPYVTLGSRVNIGRGVLLRGSVVLDGVTLMDHAIIKNSIIGKGARIGKAARVDGAVVGFDTVVKDRSHLHPGDTAWDGKK